MRLERSPKTWYGDWKSWKSEDVPRPPKVISISARIREESWRLEETCSHTDSRERPSANICVKNFQGIIVIVIAAAGGAAVATVENNAI